MIVVGITGNLASGKSAVTKVFQKLGASVFDADQAARRATRKGTPAYRAILKLFGRPFVGKDGELDRRKLAQHVFAHPGDLKKLNILIHPGVIMECLGVMERAKKRKGVLALDVPLLFESKMSALVDYTVTVRASRAASLRRAAERGIPRDLAGMILSSQWSPARKAKLSDFVIDNDGSVAELEKRAREVYARIVRQGAPKKI